MTPWWGGQPGTVQEQALELLRIKLPPWHSHLCFPSVRSGWKHRLYGALRRLHSSLFLNSVFSELHFVYMVLRIKSLFLGHYQNTCHNFCVCSSIHLFTNYLYTKHYFGPCVMLNISRNFFWDFPHGPVIKTLYFQCKGWRFDPWLWN